MDRLHPMHPSMRRELKPGLRLRPYNMDRIGITIEQKELLERIALEIFTDMSNSGASLQETLSAIYLSGLMHAIESSK